MIPFVRLLIWTLSVLLFAAFGTAASFAAPGDWTRISYPGVAQELSAQPVDLTSAARAPPTTDTNLSSTCTALAQTDDLRTLDTASICASNLGRSFLIELQNEIAHFSNHPN